MKVNRHDKDAELLYNTEEKNCLSIWRKNKKTKRTPFNKWQPYRNLSERDKDYWRALVHRSNILRKVEPCL